MSWKQIRWHIIFPNFNLEWLFYKMTRHSHLLSEVSVCVWAIMHDGNIYGPPLHLLGGRRGAPPPGARFPRRLPEHCSSVRRENGGCESRFVFSFLLWLNICSPRTSVFSSISALLWLPWYMLYFSPVSIGVWPSSLEGRKKFSRAKLAFYSVNMVIFACA